MSTAASLKLWAEDCICRDVRTACSSNASLASFTCSAARDLGGTCTHPDSILTTVPSAVGKLSATGRLNSDGIRKRLAKSLQFGQLLQGHAELRP